MAFFYKMEAAKALAYATMQNLAREAMQGGHSVVYNTPSSQENFNKVVFFKGKAIPIHKGTSLWLFDNPNSRHNPQEIKHKDSPYMDWCRVLQTVKICSFVCIAKDLANAQRKLNNFNTKGIF